jgi:hypothetical protein
MRLRQRFRQAHHIAQAEIKALPGDRMQRLRRVADQRQAMRHRAAGGGQRQRINAALPGMGNTPQPPAKRLLQL